MDHVRIDEGVKRMPQRAPDNQRNELGQYLPKLPESPEVVKDALQAYANGATLEQIADQYEVSKEAIYAWLLGDLGGQEHDKLVTKALTSRIALADMNLDSAETPLNLARAREQARFRRMDLERRRPSLYGQKQELTVTLDLGSALQSMCERIAMQQQPEKIIEGETVKE